MKIEKKELQKFNYVLLTALLIFGVVIPFFLSKQYPSPYVLWCMATLLVIGIISVRVLAPFYIFWMALGHVLGKINSFIILSAFFYAIIFPLGLFLRMLKIKSVKLGIDTQKNTYRIEPITNRSAFMEKPF